MASWRELAAAATAKSSAPTPARDDWGLDPALADALRRLEHLPAPARINSRTAWAEVVADALYLAREGWAANAIALGWDAADLFATGATNSDERDCLAVWLAGRKLAAMTDWRARTECGAWFNRETYMRPASPVAAPVWLWRFGRGR